PRGRCAGAARPDLPEPSADARVRGPRRGDEADADDALRVDRGAGHDHAVRRRGGSRGRLRAHRRGAPGAPRLARERILRRPRRSFVPDGGAAGRIQAMPSFLHTMVRITDPARSRAFYEALGFTFDSEMDIVRNGEKEATNYF